VLTADALVAGADEAAVLVSGGDEALVEFDDFEHATIAMKSIGSNQAKRRIQPPR
jgi:hypothetical protein